MFPRFSYITATWVEEVMPSTIHEDFDMSAITSRSGQENSQIMQQELTPGDDLISYHHLWNFPASHPFLANLYPLESQQCPEAWCKGRLIIVSKGENAHNPAAFRPIALTASTGKLFHKILARRMEKYCLANGFIDSYTQKGFFTRYLEQWNT